MEWVGKIFRIIFSSINNLNSALQNFAVLCYNLYCKKHYINKGDLTLHLTQTCSISPERTVAATHRHLDYF